MRLGLSSKSSHNVLSSASKATFLRIFPILSGSCPQVYVGSPTSPICPRGRIRFMGAINSVFSDTASIGTNLHVLSNSSQLLAPANCNVQDTSLSNSATATPVRAPSRASNTAEPIVLGLASVGITFLGSPGTEDPSMLISRAPISKCELFSQTCTAGGNDFI